MAQAPDEQRAMDRARTVVQAPRAAVRLERVSEVKAERGDARRSSPADRNRQESATTMPMPVERARARWEPPAACSSRAAPSRARGRPLSERWVTPACSRRSPAGSTDRPLRSEDLPNLE